MVAHQRPFGCSADDRETRLYYYRHRIYSAELGRFVSRDPIGYAGSIGNVYWYCSGRPTRSTDPLGTREQPPKGPPLQGPPPPPMIRDPDEAAERGYDPRYLDPSYPPPGQREYTCKSMGQPTVGTTEVLAGYPHDVAADSLGIGEAGTIMCIVRRKLEFRFKCPKECCPGRKRAFVLSAESYEGGVFYITPKGQFGNAKTFEAPVPFVFGGMPFIYPVYITARWMKPADAQNAKSKCSSSIRSYPPKWTGIGDFAMTCKNKSQRSTNQR